MLRPPSCGVLQGSAWSSLQCPLSAAPSPGPAPSPLPAPSGALSVFHWLSVVISCCLVLSFSIWLSLTGWPFLVVCLSPCLNVYPPISLCSFLCLCPSTSIIISVSLCLSAWISMHDAWIVCVCVFSLPVSLFPPSASLFLPDVGWSLSSRLTLPLAPPIGVSNES